MTAPIIITMNKGTVKFFNESKGFGFIKEEETNSNNKSRVIIPNNKNEDSDEDLHYGRDSNTPLHSSSSSMSKSPSSLSIPSLEEDEKAKSFLNSNGGTESMTEDTS